MSDSRRSKMAPTGPDTNGHEYVDLGLPSGTLWATMNVGATSETGYGDYYKYGSGATAANKSDSSLYTGNESPLSPLVDTARQVWGGDWHMPTKALFDELIANTDNYCSATPIFLNRFAYAYKFTSKADISKYILLPAAGLWSNGLIHANSYGCYWSSTAEEDEFAQYLRFDTNNFVETRTSYRWYGYSIRPVIG